MSSNSSLLLDLPLLSILLVAFSLPIIGPSFRTTSSSSTTSTTTVTTLPTMKSVGKVLLGTVVLVGGVATVLVIESQSIERKRQKKRDGDGDNEGGDAQG